MSRVRWGPLALVGALGAASGMPLYVLLQLLPAWFLRSGLDIQTIGAFALVGMPYAWKFAWAPLLDRYALQSLGRRRTWVLGSQLVIMGCLAAFAGFDPATHTLAIAAIALLMTTASATQDIALDAWRREILEDHELGLGSALYVNAYRLSSLVPGSLALLLADPEKGGFSWSAVHLVVAGCMGLALLVTVFASEPTVHVQRPQTLREAVVEPFQAFFANRTLKAALAVLAFMLLYKLGDSMAISMSSVFYLELGFTLAQVGTVVKAASLWSSVVGGLLGGVIMLRIGIHRSLWLFGVVQLVSILGFAWLSVVGPDQSVLFWVVSVEYLGVGLGTASFVAYIQSITDPRYTATQLALLTSFTSLPRTFANAGAGVLVERLDWTGFFLVCTALAVPGMLMLPWMAPWNAVTDTEL